MKKLLILLLSLVMIATFSVSAFATGAEDELKGVMDEIVTMVNDLFVNELDREITIDDIDFSKAFKIYIDTNVFELSTADASKIKQALEAGDYIYEVPIYINGDTVIANVQKGQPLNPEEEYTEEERGNALSRVGQWTVSAVRFHKNEIVDYYAEIRNETGDIPEGTVLVGGLPYFRLAVALLPDESGAINTLIPLNQVSDSNDIRSFRSGNSQNTFDYKLIKDFVNELPKEDTELTYGIGGTTNNTISYVLPISLLLSCFVIAVIVVIRKKAKCAKVK